MEVASELARRFHNKKVAKADGTRKTKKLFFLVSLLFALFFQTNLHALQDLSPKSDDLTLAIKAIDYCCFLNCVATTDPNHFYDDKMGLSYSGLISRSGEVGNYHYQTVNGKEESPMVFISRLGAVCYVESTGEHSPTFVSNTPSMDYDELLQSNSFIFYDTASETETVDYFSPEAIYPILAILSGLSPLLNRSSYEENTPISNQREIHRLSNTSRQEAIENNFQVVTLEPQSCDVWNRNLGAFITIFGVTMRETKAKERILKRRGMRKMVPSENASRLKLTRNLYIKSAEAIPVDADQPTIISGQIVNQDSV